MSGGAFEYLCDREPDELFEYTRQLEEIREKLIGLGADDAAMETEECLLLMRQFLVRMGVRLKRLRPVWKAVEWWCSGDYGREKVQAALKEYRNEVKT